MSRGKNLQEMEVGTKQSKSAVNASAKPAEPMSHLTTGIPDGQSATGWEDLGGPTPENYKSDDDSAKVKDPAATLKSVSDVVNAKAHAADAMKKMAMKEDAEEEDEEILDESEELEAVQEITEEDEADEEESYDEEDGEGEDDEDEELEEEFDVEEDVQALVEGEELSEEFKDKAKLIFESALRSKVNEIRVALEEQYEAVYEQRLCEEVELMKETLEDRIDSYLEYVADEWMQENTLAIEYGIKEQLSESFLSNLKNLFEDHYVQLPEEKYDVLENMVEKLDEMETKLNEQIERNIQLNKRLSESVADRIFDEVSGGLATTQKEKLASLAESVEFESEVKYREKLETLKESYFPTKQTSPVAQPETLSEGVVSLNEDYSPSMNTYMKALSMLAKN
jgi:hypothetical protein